MSKYVFKLFIAGQSPRSQRAVADVRRLCDELLDGAYDLKIIDVSQQSPLAEADRVLATPTLLKERPLPARRLIGDLSDPQKVLAGLELILGRGVAADES
jgi:circadian clock protein KaiB